MLLRCLGILVTVSVAACGVDGEAATDRPQPEPDVTILSEGEAGVVGVTAAVRMQVDLLVAAPGTAVQVNFPNREVRGPSFMLERFEAGVWRWEWAIHSEPAPADPRVWTAQEFMRQGASWAAEPRFASVEPHVVPVPDTARPGEYRVCTVGLPDKLCAEFEVALP